MRRVFDNIATAACVAAGPFAIEQPHALDFIPMLCFAAGLDFNIFIALATGTCDLFVFFLAASFTCLLLSVCAGTWVGFERFLVDGRFRTPDTRTSKGPELALWVDEASIGVAVDFVWWYAMHLARHVEDSLDVRSFQVLREDPGVWFAACGVDAWVPED